METKESYWRSTLHVQRFILGVTCGLLPILCLLFGLLSCTKGGDSIWLLTSVSATYYTHHKIIMIGALLVCFGFLICYKGHDLGDRIYTIIAAIGALGVAAFPCMSRYAESYEGLFSTPIALSNALHYVSAVMVFGSFGLMTLTQFTKTLNKAKKIVYIVCGCVQVAALVSLAVAGVLLDIAILPITINGITYDFTVMFLEIFMLEGFAVAWIVKADPPFLKRIK